MSEAILFPGQGAHAPGMRSLVAQLRPDLLELACELVGADPFARIEDGTRFAQPAIFCAALAGWARLRAAACPLAMAGHSLGELAALVAAGALASADGLRLAVVRGRLTQAAASAGDGGMLAVLGAEPAVVAALAMRHGVTVANENAPAQVVLSGRRRALGAVEDALRGSEARTRRLAVDGAFHSPAMAAAVPAFRAALAEVPFAIPRVPVWSCTTARPFADPREELAAALTQPVRWTTVLRALAARGATRFVDVGPGRVLAGLAARTLRGVEVHAVQAPRRRAASVAVTQGPIQERTT
jgi:[acyl-carrier-protein] S-malonyltransferase